MQLLTDQKRRPWAPTRTPEVGRILLLAGRLRSDEMMDDFAKTPWILPSGYVKIAIENGH